MHNYLYFSGALTTFSIERQSKLEKKEKEGRGKMDALEKPNWWEIEKNSKSEGILSINTTSTKTKKKKQNPKLYRLKVGYLTFWKRLKTRFVVEIVGKLILKRWRYYKWTFWPNIEDFYKLVQQKGEEIPDLLSIDGCTKDSYHFI